MLDDLDNKLLEILQLKGRTKRNELAEVVSLSVPAVSERLKKLEDHGVIEGYYTKVNRKAYGLDILAFIYVIMDSSKYYKDLIKNVEHHRQILECHSVLGDGSHLLKVLVRNTEALERLLSEIQSWSGVTSTKTTYVLSTIKETTAINI